MSEHDAMTNITFDVPKREALRRAYNAAVEGGQRFFEFEGTRFLVAYAKHVIALLDMRLPPIDNVVPLSPKPEKLFP